MTAAWAGNSGITFAGDIDENASAVLSPLSASAVSFSDTAALRLRSANAAGETAQLNYIAYDSASHPVGIRIWSGKRTLRPGEATIATVILPLTGDGVSNFRICAVLTTATGAQLDRMCGRYRLERRLPADQQGG